MPCHPETPVSPTRDVAFRLVWWKMVMAQRHLRMAIRRDIHDERRRENTLHTIIVVATLGLLLVFTGWITAGLFGILIALGAFVVAVALTPRMAPALLFRLYRARPLSPATNPGLTEWLQVLAQRAGLPSVPRLYLIPSPIHNAFATGLGDPAAIGLTAGILNDFSSREVAGILAHEISHIKHQDTRVMALADTMNRLTALASQMAVLLIFLSLPLIALGLFQVSWIPLFLLILAPSAANLLQLSLSRTREYAADLEAARLTGDPRGLASALLRLDRLSASHWEMIMLPGRRLPEPSVLRTHPPTEERVRRLLELRSDPLTHTWQALPANPLQIIPLTTRAAQANIRRPSWHLSGLWY